MSLMMALNRYMSIEVYVHPGICPGICPSWDSDLLIYLVWGNLLQISTRYRSFDYTYRAELSITELDIL